MPGKTVETRFKAKGTSQMERQLRGIEHQLKDIGNAGKNLKEGLSNAGVGIGIAIAGLGALKLAAEAAAAATVALAREMKKLSDRGADLSAVSARFETLGSSELLANMQRATGQLVSSFDLMRASNVALANEMLSDEQWTQWSALVTRAAQDTGRDVTTSINQLAQAFTGGGVEFLGQLGIEMGSVKDRVREMGLSMESAEGRMAALALAGDQLEDSYAGIDNSAGNSGDALQQVTVVLEDFRDAVAEAFAEDEQLIGSLTGLADQLRPMIPMALEVGRAIADMAVAMIRVAVESAPMLAAALQGTIRIFEVTIQAHADVMGALGRDNTGWNQLVDSLRATRYSAGRLSDAFVRLGRTALAAGQQAGAVWEEIPVVWEEITPEPRTRRRRGGGGARQQSATDRLMEEDVSATGLFDEIGERQDQLEQQRHELRMSRLNEQKDFEIELAEKRLEVDAASKAADIEHAEIMAAKQQEVRDAAAEAAAAIKEKINTGASIAQTAAGSLNTIGGAFGAMADKKAKDLEATRAGMREMGMTEKQITAATKDREKAVARARKAEGAFMVAQNVVLAATEVARAIGAIPNPVLIASHSAAAVAHVVAAGIAASKLGGGGGGGASVSLPPKPSVSEFTPAETDNIEQTTNNGPGQTNVVNYYSLGRSGEDLGRALKEAEYEFERSDGRAVTGAGVSYS